ncbi:b149.7 [miniopterid betaherpesvirus 1]|uniref:B149.7 n=1 Tax=miniopterid betaherpesvirus 1 TaxID=3070189 RepID=I3VQG6_9BETA|nr:b149.7 [miniopterid betaherpesvirus 1]AFK84010.1 b149.7 [miniopterid betaherpesvirus 1]
MAMRRGLCYFVISACIWQLVLRQIYGTSTCLTENDKYYEEGDSVKFSCEPREMLYVFPCHLDAVHLVMYKDDNFGNLSFTSDFMQGVKGSGPFDYSILGRYECNSGSECVRREYILGRHVVTSSYERQGDKDIFTCKTPFPDVVALKMHINGSYFHDHRDYLNGTIQYIAPLIHKARCEAYMWCVQRQFFGPTFYLHDDGFTFAKNETGRLDCFRTAGETAYLWPVMSDIGGRFSDQDDVTVTNDQFNESTTCGWCIMVSSDSISISDMLSLNNASTPCDITETLNRTTGAFVLNAGISSVNVALRLAYLVSFILYMYLLM